MRERRSAVRMLCADLVEVCWLRSREEQKAQAVLKDISPSGACLQLETAVPLNAVIRWSWPERDFAGVVRYCSYRQIGYFVGGQFDPACRWSETHHRPQYLLDREQLITRRA